MPMRHGNTQENAQVLDFPAKAPWLDGISFGKWKFQFRCADDCEKQHFIMTDFTWSFQSGISIPDSCCENCGAEIEFRSVDISSDAERA